MSDPIEELHLLREQTDVLLQQSEEIQSRLGPVNAQDSTGEVSVKVSPSGMLESIQIGFAWERSLSPDQLGPAVLEAVAAAGLVRLEEYGNAAIQVQDEPTPRARPAAPTYEAQAMGERFAQSDDAGDAAGAFFEDVLSEAIENLDEADRIVSEHARRVHHGRSSSGHVRADVSSSGQLTGLDIDGDWIKSAHPANLGREITQAVRAGVERSLRDGLVAALAASKLAGVASRAAATPTTAPTSATYRED